MELDRTKVSRFRIQCGHAGGVFCQPLNMRFPAAYRIVASATREQLDDLGCFDVEPFADVHCYTLKASAKGTELRALDAVIDRISLVIRYHRSCDEALAYLGAFDDFGTDDNGGEPIFQTKEGIFTLITRPIKPSWPGPLIIYCASDVPADNRFGMDAWAIAIAPNGTVSERFDDFIDSP